VKIHCNRYQDLSSSHSTSANFHTLLVDEPSIRDMKFLKDIRRRSTTTFRKLQVSSDSQLSRSSDSSSGTQNAGTSSPDIVISSNESVEHSPPSSTGTSPSPSEFALASTHDVTTPESVRLSFIPVYEWLLIGQQETTPEPLQTEANGPTRVIPHIDNLLPGQMACLL
jgi:hypothetical protein